MKDEFSDLKVGVLTNEDLKSEESKKVVSIFSKHKKGIYLTYSKKILILVLYVEVNEGIRCYNVYL